MIDGILPAETDSLLKKMGTQTLPQGAYLAGGTACALWLGHRKSVDLDFFVPTEFEVVAWRQKWEQELDFEMLNQDWQILEGQAQDVKLALFYYRYPLIEPTTNYQGIQVASLEDLAAIKLETLIGRGTKRDFIDLYFLVKKLGLKSVFGCYDRKYGNFETRELLIRKALVYFAEADNDEMPNMLVPAEWKSIKKYFEKAIF